MKSPILTFQELCDEFGISTRTGYRLVKSGCLAGYKQGQKWKFNRESIDGYLASRNAPDRPLTVFETCGLLQRSSAQVHALIKAGRLQATKEHHEFRIDRDSLKRYMVERDRA